MLHNLASQDQFLSEMILTYRRPMGMAAWPMGFSMFFSIDQHQPGILIYEMIVGYPPFVDEDPHLGDGHVEDGHHSDRMAMWGPEIAEWWDEDKSFLACVDHGTHAEIQCFLLLNYHQLNRWHWKIPGRMQLLHVCYFSRRKGLCGPGSSQDIFHLLHDASTWCCHHRGLQTSPSLMV